MKKRYHLDLDRRMVSGAAVALLPGDPGRVDTIATSVAKAYSSFSTPLASKREFTTYLTEANGKKCSSLPLA